MQQDAAANNAKKHDFIHCAHCGTRNKEEDYSCSRCGERLFRPDPGSPPPMGLVACQKCSTSNVSRASYCVTCGATLETPVRVSPSAAPATATAGASGQRLGAPVSRGRYEPPARQTDQRRQDVRQPAAYRPRPVSTSEHDDDGTESGKADSRLPRSLRRFNWGAFLLGPVWGIGNMVMPAIIIGFGGIIAYYLVRTNPWAGFIILLVTDFVIGAKANEWAWKSRKWQSVEQFRRVQQSWLLWGVIFNVVLLMALVYISRNTASAIAGG